MTQVRTSIDVTMPVQSVYNQWTQFESFPEFLSFVESITQIDDTHTHWKVKIAGVEREFDATIAEQHPDERVAWNSTGGDEDHAGVVTFHRLSDTSSRVTVQLDWAAEGFFEEVGAVFGIDDHVIKSDLKQFKKFIESRATSTGAWRGDIQH